MPDLDIPELQTDFLFRRRPVAIPGDLRPAWRIGMVVLLLKKCCRSSRSSLTRLHVLSWGVRTKENRRELQDVVNEAIDPDAVIVRFEPFLSRAVDFAIGEGLLRRVSGGKVELTSDGTRLADELAEADSAFTAEKEFMDAIRTKVTETMVNQMFGWKE